MLLSFPSTWKWPSFQEKLARDQTRPKMVMDPVTIFHPTWRHEPPTSWWTTSTVRWRGSASCLPKRTPPPWPSLKWHPTSYTLPLHDLQVPFGIHITPNNTNGTCAVACNACSVKWTTKNLSPTQWQLSQKCHNQWIVSAVAFGIYISYCLSSCEMATATTVPGPVCAPLSKAIACLVQVQLQHQCPLTA
jgi:hypothetical protein